MEKSNQSGTRTLPQEKDGILKYSRIVVKAGTGVLTDHGEKLHMPTIRGLVKQIALLRSTGVEVLLVTSGAIAAGKHLLGFGGDRHDVTVRQASAAVGQNRLMQIYSSLFEDSGVQVAQALLTRRDLEDRQGYLNVRNALLMLMDRGALPIINENDVVAVEELGPVFGDNDTLSALVSNLVDADLLAILTDIDGLFTADPNLYSNATLVRKVERIDSQIESLGAGSHNSWSRGGMPSKLEAAKLATLSGVTVVICNGRTPDVLARVVSGESIGTLFCTSSSRIESRKRWMLSGLATRGRIIIDGGAEKAVIEQNRSLLPAGVKDVVGDFRRGDVVYLENGRGDLIACGLTNYDSEQVSSIMGHKSSDIQHVLGCNFGHDVIHRNNLVLL